MKQHFNCIKLQLGDFLYSPMRIENIRFGLCWHQQYQFIARPWPKIIPDAQTEYLQVISLIGSVIMNMKTAGFSKIWSNHLIQLSSCSRLLLVLQVGHSRHFLITKYTHSTTSGKLCNIFLVRHDKIRTTGSKRSLEKASICLYSSEEKNLETMRHDC